MVGVELMTTNSERGAILVDHVLEEMKDQGFIIGKNGINRNVLAFQPPLVIQVDDIQNMLEKLDIVLEKLEAAEMA
ncbi:hypothetical protein D3C76_1629210 [compost metagenome]